MNTICLIPAWLRSAFFVWTSVATGLLSGSAYAAPGDLDASFGAGGKVTTDFGELGQANALTLASGGKIVATGVSGSVGPFTTNNPNFALARYNPDGSLDTSFGSGSKVTTDFGLHDQAFAVATQPDGKIVAAGSTGNVFSFTALDFAIARYNPNGSLDTSFGSGGKVTTNFFGQADEAHALIVQPDGKIVAVGYALRSNGLPDFALARYNADGSLDTSFGSGGKVTTEFPGTLGASAEAFGATLQPDGRIIASGFARPGFNTDFALARYNGDGSLDSSFGVGGMVTTDIGQQDKALAVALQSDGKIVAAGTADFTDFTLARYETHGNLDNSFGTGGTVTVFPGGNGEARAVAIQQNGKIVAAGRAGPFGLFDFTLLRLDPDGAPDSTFGIGGMTMTDFANNNDEAHATLIQPDGNIIAGGVALTTRYDFALARYLGDPTTETTEPFSTFQVRLELQLGLPDIHHDNFEIQARFKLGTGSDGIDLSKDNVMLTMGTFSMPIPAGSFRVNPHGLSTFKGVISGVRLEAIVKSRGHGLFSFQAEGVGADLTGTANPVPVILTIGNDRGSTSVIAETN